MWGLVVDLNTTWVLVFVLSGLKTGNVADTKLIWLLDRSVALSGRLD